MPARGLNTVPEAFSDQIHDNAKRSVSIRINTSDYGRIKIAAQRLRVREADVFRYLVKIGLSQLGPLLNGSVDERSMMSALTEFGPDLCAHFGLDVTRLRALLNVDTAAPAAELATADLELITLSATHPLLVQTRLESLLGRSIAESELDDALAAYLESKYSGASLQQGQ